MSDMIDAQAEMVCWLEEVEFEVNHQLCAEHAPDIIGLACTLLDFPGKAQVLVGYRDIGRLYISLTEVVTDHDLSDVQAREKLAEIDRLVDRAWEEVDDAYPQPA